MPFWERQVVRQAQEKGRFCLILGSLRVNRAGCIWPLPQAGYLVYRPGKAGRPSEPRDSYLGSNPRVVNRVLAAALQLKHSTQKLLKRQSSSAITRGFARTSLYRSSCVRDQATEEFVSLLLVCFEYVCPACPLRKDPRGFHAHQGCLDLRIDRQG